MTLATDKILKALQNGFSGDIGELSQVASVSVSTTKKHLGLT